MSASKPETKMSAEAAERLEALGFIVLRLQAGKARVKGGWMQGNRAGCPDRAVLLSRARIAFLEAKVGNGKPSPDQERWHALAKRRGHIVITFWTPLEAVRAVIAAEKTA